MSIDDRGLASRRAPGSWPYALVVLIGCLVLLPRLGSFGFWDPWEPKYAQSAREMLERGSFVVPYYLGEVRLTKPILTYWGLLAGYAVFGVSELGARIGGACMALLSLVGVLYAVGRVRGRRAGLLGACVLATCPQFVFLARQATPDVYLLTSLGCGLVFLGLVLHGGTRGRTLHVALAAAALALAVLAKGPVIVGAIVAGALLLHPLTRPEFRELLRSNSRRELARYAAVLVACLAAFGILAPLAFLLATSPEWWWYNDAGRAAVGGVRYRILDLFSTTSLDRILLGTAAAGYLAAALFALRDRPSPPRVLGRVGPRLVLAAVAVGLLFVPGTGTRILAASLLGLVFAMGWLRVATERFLHRALLPREPAAASRRFGFSLLVFAAVFLAVAGPWHVAILLSQQSGYFTDFILEHNVARAGKVASQTGGPGFYMPVVLFGMFPWSCLIPAGVVLAWRVWRPETARRRGFEIFLGVASLVTLTAFSGATTKFPHYIAPLLIPMAVLIGIALDSMLDRRSRTVTSAWCVAALSYLPGMFVLTSGKGAEQLIATFTVKSSVAAEFAPGAPFSVLLGTLAVCWFVAVPLRSRARMGVVFVSIALLLAGYLSLDLMPRLTRDKTMQALCLPWSESAERTGPLGIHGEMKFGLHFYTNREVRELGDLDAFLEFMSPDRPAMSVVQRSRLRIGRRAYLARYPGHDLHIVERSHRSYATVINDPAADR